MYLPGRLAGAKLDTVLLLFEDKSSEAWAHAITSVSSASFCLLIEIYLVRMSTSEFGSMILFNKDIFHLITVDPILKFEIV